MTYCKLCISCVVIILLAGCKTAKDVATPAEWKGRWLQFGSGGGFTGASDVYTLLDNGQMFLTTGIGNAAAKALPKADKNKTKVLFEQAAKINWGDKDISEPGNMYYKVAYNNTVFTRQITWGSSNYQAPEQITQLYTNLKSLTASQKQ